MITSFRILFLSIGLCIRLLLLCCSTTSCQVTYAKSVSFNPVAPITSLFVAVWSEASSKKEWAYKLVVQEKRIQDSIGNVLDPLLKIIAVEYIDHASLASSLAEIFRFLLKTVGE